MKIAQSNWPVTLFWNCRSHLDSEHKTIKKMNTLSFWIVVFTKKNTSSILKAFDYFPRPPCMLQGAQCYEVWQESFLMEVLTFADDRHKLRRSNDCLDFMTLGTSLRPIKASPLIYYIMHGALTVKRQSLVQSKISSLFA